MLIKPIKILLPLFLFMVFFSNVVNALETFPITFSETTKPIHAFGRIMPDFGSLKIEKATTFDQIEEVLVVEGQRILHGTKIVKLKSPCQLKSSDCFIRAQQEGLVGELLRFKGSNIKPDDGLISVFNPNKISVRLDIPLRYLSSIQIGQKIYLIDYNQTPEVKYISEVVEILPSVGVADTTRGVRLKILTPVKTILLTTMLDAEIHIPFNNLAENSISFKGAKIPVKSLSFFQAKHFIIKKENSNLIPVEVEVLSETDRYAWIKAKNKDELQEGSKILSANSIFYIRSLLEEKN